MEERKWYCPYVSFLSDRYRLSYPLCSLYFPILIFAVISALKGKRGTVVETGDKTSTHGPPGVEGEYLQGVVGSVSIKFSSSSREPDYWM